MEFSNITITDVNGQPHNLCRAEVWGIGGKDKVLLIETADGEAIRKAGLSQKPPVGIQQIVVTNPHVTIRVLRWWLRC